MRLSALKSKRFFPFGFLALTLLFIYGCSQESYEEQFLTNPEAAGESKHRVSWHEVTDKHPCYPKIQRRWRSAFRVNCFQIDGELHTHSNRIVEYNQRLANLLGYGDAWVYVVAEKPDLLVAIDGEVHNMRTELIDDEERRNKILLNRGFDPVPEAMRVYRLVSLP